jgi:hypothetical protein
MRLRLLALLENFRLAIFRLAISCATIAMAQIGLACAAEFIAADGEDGKTILLLDGKIQRLDSEKLNLMVLALDIQKRGVSVLYLNSPGGNHDDAVRMAEVVKRYKISTIVADGSKCASGCFTVFAAGHEKFAGYDTRLGVHRSSEQGQETEFAFAGTFETARILSELGVPPAIVGKLVLTPPDGMAWLTPDDLRSMNVTITDTLRWPGAGARLTPLEAAVKPDDVSWLEYVAETLELSLQEFGPGNLREICDLYRLLCVRYFYFFDRHDLATRVTTFEDMSGNVVRREVCKFNMARTVRACFDWDTLEKSHATIEADGRWKQVAGEQPVDPVVEPLRRR